MCHWEQCSEPAAIRIRWRDDGAEAAYCDAHAALARMHGAVPTRPKQRPSDAERPKERAT